MSSNHSQRAYRHIRKKLLDGSVTPGARLSYGTIGKEIGISATPVREAVGQLASEGFVELVPQLGAVVRELTRDEAIELYELREALESYAAARAAERIGDRQLSELRENLEQSRILTEEVRKSGKTKAGKAIAKKFHALDLSFHMTIIEASRNQRMLKVVGDSHILTRIFQADRHSFSQEILDATLSEHSAIESAVRKGDGSAAREAMQRHIRNSLELTLDETDVNSSDRWWTE
ncbi:GntR family transcriptional regulator [Verrucomicrobiales bacterium]|nr:GntR family transcriptional regulator [Verrucomicrobiales bacterium]MDC3352755.1 GntR family transcriptional regulator [Verrucomicrobiales bacterium]